MAQHNELGNTGEEQAKAYLSSKGYSIRHINWVAGKLELDIVAEKDGLLVIVEVKTRSNEFFEHPAEAVTPRKIKNLVLAAEEYIFRFDWQGETRFDIISVIPEGNSYRIVHLEDAFLPPVN